MIPMHIDRRPSGGSTDIVNDLGARFIGGGRSRAVIQAEEES
jgi:hypothetical protein